MDGQQYHANGMSNNNQQYSSLPGISPGIAPHQLQHNNGLPAHTLPPLQNPQHATMSMYGGSAPHTPRTPATPGTPGSASTMGTFPQIGGPSRGGGGGYQMMPGNTYQQQNQQYRTSDPIMSQSSSTAMSQPQNIAPAPAQHRMPQQLRPMPPNGMQQHQQQHHHQQQQHMQAMQSPYGPGMMMQEMEPPTHVVGSQGRRGILPSAPGRPPPVAAGTGSTKNAMIPAKDADGKFPCPHCTKTYLHAKHLKRHLLRHTGDRPYMCVLCRDTFSRSDILKRHFQKCSIRRGNPTGASHLSHAQAHLKKPQAGHKPTGSMGAEGDMMGVNGLNHMGQPQALHPFGVIPDGGVPDAGPNLTEEQAEKLSRSDSLQRMGAGGGENRSMTGPGPGGSNRASFAQGYPGAIASTMPTGMNPSLAYNVPHRQNDHSYSQGYDYVSHGSNGSSMQPQSNVGIATLQNRNVYHPASAGQQPQWSHLYSGPPPTCNPPYPSTLPPSQPPVKQEPLGVIKAEPLPNSNPALFNGLYPGGPPHALASPTDFPTWDLEHDPLQEVASKLLFFCFPNNQVVGRGHEIRQLLSADGIKHFLEHFTNFQGHFPFIHMPTFRITDVFEGLLLAMICVGAVYSERVAAVEVRDMMEFAKVGIERHCSIYSGISPDYQEPDHAKEALGSNKSELEQLTALFMMHVLFTWHGTPVQREQARRQFPTIVALARKAGLTTPVTTAAKSALHQRHVKVESFHAGGFDWHAWVEQEKRSRLMYAIYLTDAAMSIYFTTSSLFDALEIRLPLPTDDATWDARTASQCAEALGLHGAGLAVQRNPAGSRRPKQPEMHSALETLMRNDLDLQPGTTNLYSKFILIHALHVQLSTTLKQLSQEPGSTNGHAPAFPSSGSSTPLAQNDWVVRGVEGTASGASSGRGTPIDSAGHQHVQAISQAFEKWKKVWDEDMAVQYPPSSTSYRRFGFCRDGVHFYWLGKYLMKNNRHSDWHMAPDQRFSQVINLLKYVKTYVSSDAAKRGEELGSVSEIDSDFGSSDLTLDMSQLFKPVNKQIHSAVMGVHTGSG
ncbi:fungal-specific transcription factor domain-containing protein [Amylocarpus encephaloides]|uniref:Fungal-specific transcription factor domain-containing protein n=1 Tax=Amylocarpus encephaloides TaxID=45428 RepID=A0A9P8C2A0_9HELO|nr:fungal-specific transcription factor domain-containing protein [Amylocarpus encephaloides]